MKGLVIERRMCPLMSCMTGLPDVELQLLCEDTLSQLWYPPFPPTPPGLFNYKCDTSVSSITVS